jgi:hypothetical protein
MSISVPPAIEQYFAAAPTGDVVALLDAFTADATVIDEGETHRGTDEIRAWREAVNSAFTYTVEVLSATQVGAPELYEVVGHLVGDFPGSPVDLTFRFGLREGKIASLVIAP